MPGLNNVPADSRGFIRLVGNLLEYGVEKIPVGAKPAPTKADISLDGMSVPELQTKCAMKGIAYDRADNKTVLLAKLKAKS